MNTVRQATWPYDPTSWQHYARQHSWPCLALPGLLSARCEQCFFFGRLSNSSMLEPYREATEEEAEGS